MTRVGFVGLGRMGVPMATNLAAAGFELGLWNRSIDRAEHLAQQTNATVCTTPRELAEHCDAVITMLADDTASEQVHLGETGLFAAATGARHGRSRTRPAGTRKKATATKAKSARAAQRLGRPSEASVRRRARARNSGATLSGGRTSSTVIAPVMG